jgi:Zn-dependent protease
MLFTIQEIIDLVIMIFATGYIFSSFVKRQPHEGYDPLTYYGKSSFVEDLKYGIIIAAPAIVLHELAHKFMAMAFGVQATLHAPELMGIPYGWYILIIVMQALKVPLLFFVGGYVEHRVLPPFQSIFVSLAGPLTNLLIFFVCMGLVRYKIVNRKHYHIIGMASKLNLFLFVFNLIPFPGFDGFNAIMGLIRLFL